MRAALEAAGVEFRMVDSMVCVCLRDGGEAKGSATDLGAADGQ